MPFLLKLFISALFIACVSEIAKRHTFIGALVISWPLTSLLTILWLYIETQNPTLIQSFSWDVLWLTIPGLIFFVILPLLLRYSVNFYLALLISLFATAGFYSLWILLKTKWIT